MPPHLDLSKTYAHADMLLAARKSPRISLRKAASYNLSVASSGPQSSTSSRCSSPLEPATYAEMCVQSTEVAMHVQALHAHAHREMAAHYGYYHVDPYFMDVAEAEAHGLLPGEKTSVREDSVVGEELLGRAEV